METAGKEKNHFIFELHTGTVSKKCVCSFKSDNAGMLHQIGEDNQAEPCVLVELSVSVRPEKSEMSHRQKSAACGDGNSATGWTLCTTTLEPLCMWMLHVLSAPNGSRSCCEFGFVYAVVRFLRLNRENVYVVFLMKTHHFRKVSLLRGNVSGNDVDFMSGRNFS